MFWDQPLIKFSLNIYFFSFGKYKIVEKWGKIKVPHTFPVPLLNRWVPVYDILKCKNFLIDFRDELGNFKL